MNSPSRPRHHLPAWPTRFLGRETELEALRPLAEGTGVLTLSGPAGVGKSRLAHRLAEERLEQYRGGVWWVSLETVAEPEWVLQAVARTMGLQECPECPLSDSLIAAIYPWPLLLVLDNVDRLRPACARLIETLRKRCPRLKIVVTSRVPLGLPAETVWHTPPLCLEPPAAGPLAEQPPFDALTLFIQRAAAAGSEFSDEEAAAAADLCRRLEGSALAIEWAAAWTPVAPPSRILAEWDAVARRTGATLDPVTTALHWSAGRLSERERHFLANLSVFSGGWTAEAAAAVGVRHGTLQPHVDAMLERLVARGLIVTAVPTVVPPADCEPSEPPAEPTADEPPRFSMPEVAREFWAARLARSSRAADVYRRHTDWCLEFLRQAAYARGDRSGGRSLDMLETEHDNLRAALQRSIGFNHRLAASRLATGIWWFWSERGYWTEGRRCLAAVLAIGERTGGRSRLGGLRGSIAAYQELAFEAGAALLIAALILAFSGFFSGSPVSHWAQRMPEALLLRRGGGTAMTVLLAVPWFLLSRARTHLLARADVLYAAGALAYAQDDFSSAHGLLRGAWRIIRWLPTTVRSVNVRVSLGMVAALQGDIAAASAHIERARIIATKRHWKEAASDAIFTLGKLHHHVETRERHAAARGRMVRANAALLRGDYERARTLYEEGAALWREISEPWANTMLLLALGDVAFCQADLGRASELWEQSRDLAREHSLSSLTSSSLVRLGQASLAGGSPAEARARYEECLEGRRWQEDPSPLGGALLGMGRLSLSAGEPAAAVEWFTEALVLTQERVAGLPPGVDPNAAQASQATRDAEEAQGPLEDDRLGDCATIVECLEGIGAAAGQLSSGERAARLFGAAHALREQWGLPRPPVDHAVFDGWVAAARNDLDQAAFDAAWAAGSALSADEAIALGMGAEPHPDPGRD